HEHRPADRQDLRRGPAVAPVPQLERAREPARRVVADDRPRLYPEPLERVGLELGVLDDGAPEQPRVRDDDADLHPRQDIQPSRRTGIATSAPGSTRNAPAFGRAATASASSVPTKWSPTPSSAASPGGSSPASTRRRYVGRRCGSLS